MPEYFLRSDLASGDLSGAGSAADLLRWARSVAEAAPAQALYRDREGRRTLHFSHTGRGFFLKLHSGIGWAEVFKNLLQGRWPVLGATNEYRAVRALQRIGVDTLEVAAYARTGHNPAALQSMIVTDELTGTITLEDYCARWTRVPPPPAVRLRLLLKLADSARRMHAAGINHRDFYLCHFHLDESSLQAGPLRCYLIDLHRAQLRRRTPRRWRVKDLAGLYFSAMDCGLGRRDLLRFMHHYSEGGLRRALGEDAALWRQVARRTERLYRKGLPMEGPVSAESRVIRGAGWAARLQRELALPPADAAAWMEQHTQLLKRDTHSRVGLLQLQGELCALKLYRPKSVLQAVLFRLGRGRPVRGFDIASRIASAGLPVPQPRACLRVPGGVLLLSEGLVDAVDLHTLWRDGPGAEQCRDLLADAGALLARLHRNGFAHGDCKWHNLLYSGGQLWLVDIDGARAVAPGHPGQARDLARFTLDAEELALDRGLYEHFLDHYLRGTGATRDETLRRMQPILDKLRARHRARYGERGKRLL